MLENEILKETKIIQKIKKKEIRIELKLDTGNYFDFAEETKLWDLANRLRDERIERVTNVLKPLKQQLNKLKSESIVFPTPNNVYADTN